MFRKTCFILVAGLLAITGLASLIKAQSTVSTTVDFDVVQPRAGDIRLRVFTPAYLSVNGTGGVLSPGGVNVITSVDSLDSYADGKDLQWVITVEGYSSADSLLYLKRQEFDLRTGRLNRTDRDTADYSAGYGKYAGTAHTDSLTFGRTPMMNMSLNTWAVLVQPIAKNYAYYLYLLHEKMVPGSREGSVATYSVPYPDTLTVIKSDTLLMARTDTSYTSAITGDCGYVTLFITGSGITSDTVPTLHLAMQRKIADGAWAGPLTASSYNTTAQILFDSLTVKHGATKTYDISSWGPADSLRWRTVNPSKQGRTIWTIKALWRD